MRPRPIVTLTTDFGAGSPYVAAMKGALLGACRDAILVDIAHSVPAFDVRAAAFILWAGSRSFPAGSVHLAVVDPGVGSARRAIAARFGDSYFVGPDNGLFSLVAADGSGDAAGRVVELRRPPDASPTFEGRDVFAPAAGRLAAGDALEEVGEPADARVTTLALENVVLWVDGFGNLVTSLRPPVEGVRIASATITRTVRTYAEAETGALFFYVGSMGLIEIGIREGRADALLGAGPGTPVTAL